ncbi:MAG: bis(5'-nucleosyl)-tetraphosphatase [Planctomycetota bacterium]
MSPSSTPLPTQGPRAAGIVVYRRKGANVEVLVLRAVGCGHWTPPKGHLDGEESPLEAALRETREESGLAPPGLRIDIDFLEEIRYPVERRDGSGRTHEKVVTYFLGEVDKDATVTISDEHDAFLWLSPEKAAARCGFENLTAVLRKADEWLSRGTRRLSGIDRARDALGVQRAEPPGGLSEAKVGRSPE